MKNNQILEIECPICHKRGCLFCQGKGSVHCINGMEGIHAVRVAAEKYLADRLYDNN